MGQQSDIDTETVHRRPRSTSGLLVRIGNHKLTVPVTTIVAGCLTALGTAYQVVASDRDEILARLAAQERTAAEHAKKLEIDQIVLAEIRTQLAMIHARLAEVQVTLMRQNRP